MKTLQEIFEIKNLYRSWDIVRSKNKSGGIDNVVIPDFEKEIKSNIYKLQHLLLNQKFTPEAYKTIYIDKNKSEKRKITIPTIKDKIVQVCIMLNYQSYFEKMFSENSFAYRYNKSHAKAINRISEYISTGQSWFLNCDIDNFFDTIDRKILIEKLRVHIDISYIISLIEVWIRIGNVYREKYRESEYGIPQGSVLSPLMSNVYLNDIDKDMDAKKISFVRYSDNIIIAGSTKQELENINCKLITDLSALNLKLNSEDTAVSHIDKGFSFCGIHFINGKKIISPSRLEKKKSKISDIVLRNNFEEIIIKINEYFEGIRKYFSPFDTRDQFLILEEHFKDRLKSKILDSADKDPKFKYRDILKMIYKVEYLTERNSCDKDNIYKTILSEIRKSLNTTVSDPEEEINVNRQLNFKRKKYNKIFYTNVDIIISIQGSQLGKSAENIVIRNPGSAKKEISSNKVKNIIITSPGVTISSNVLELCSQKDIRIDFLDGIGKPYCTFISPTSDFFDISAMQSDVSLRNKQLSITFKLIEAKIKNQINLIKYFLKNRESSDETRKNLQEEAEKIERHLDELNNLDFNLDLTILKEQILGYEGICASLYWKCVNTLLPEEYIFEKREHKGTKDLVNMLFNYAYGILYTKVLAAVTIAGLNPNIGFFHSRQKGKPVLIYDIIEQFRAPFADRAVISLLTKGSKVNKENDLLSKDTRNLIANRVLSRLNTEVVYKNKRMNNNSIILEKAKELVKYLKGEEKVFKPFVMKW